MLLTNDMLALRLATATLCALPAVSIQYLRDLICRDLCISDALPQELDLQYTERFTRHSIIWGWITLPGARTRVKRCE
eukprot:IDg6033t1